MIRNRNLGGNGVNLRLLLLLIIPICWAPTYQVPCWALYVFFSHLIIIMTCKVNGLSHFIDEESESQRA